MQLALAYRSSAVPETLAGSGLLFTEKRFPEVAALASLIVEDDGLRRPVLAMQRSRRRAFLPEAVVPALLTFVSEIAGDAAIASGAAASGQRRR